MHRVRVPWTGLTGLPGVSTFYLTTVSTTVAPLATFFNSIFNYVPTGGLATIPGTGDVIDESTGLITGAWTKTGAGTAAGFATAAAYSAPSGAVIDWLTGLVINGRRVQGRTFMVPLASVAYQSDGTLASGVITAIKTAADALIAAYGDALRVWSRPQAGVMGRAGASVQVIASRVPDMAAVLRSRRS